MPLDKAADDLITVLANTAKQELAARTAPILRKLADALSDLEKTLAGAGRRGKRGPGRPPASAAPVAPAEEKVRRRRGRKGKRGALKASIVQVLSSSRTPLSPAKIRDILMADPEYKGRKARSLYTQIIVAIKKDNSIHKTDRGEYSMKAGRK